MKKQKPGLEFQIETKRLHLFDDGFAVFHIVSVLRRYRHRIAEMTESKGARFLDYDCDKGLWQFCAWVLHSDHVVSLMFFTFSYIFLIYSDV